MEDQLISFETAKLAKEKGFNLDVSYLYKEYCILFKKKYENGSLELGGTKDSNGWRQKKCNWNSINFDNVRNGDIQHSAPTQSLLQKWLRDNHNIDLGIYYWDTGIYSYRIQKIVNKRMKYLDGSDSRGIIFVGSYEETLEKALQKALKFIK